YSLSLHDALPIFCHGLTSLLDDTKREDQVTGQPVDRCCTPTTPVNARLHGRPGRPQVTTPPVVIAPADSPQVALQRNGLSCGHWRRLHLPVPPITDEIAPFPATGGASSISYLAPAATDPAHADVDRAESCVGHLTSPRTSPCAPGASPVPPPS